MKTPLRVATVLVLLAATALYVRLNPPRRLALSSEALTAFPTELNSWRGVDLEFSEVVAEELAADDTLARRYIDEHGNSVWFVIIFHQNERYGAHEPVVCYTAQGWSVVDRGLTPLSRQGGGFDANWLLIEARGQKRVAVYWWYTAGDLATGDRDTFMARMATAGVRSNVTFGAFVRVSVAVGDGGFDEALSAARGFAEEALPHIPELFSEDE
ncbi:MAG: exosortase C-terminal domain/associated protein EpsI [Candidatus Eisenbacteria bacterium]